MALKEVCEIVRVVEPPGRPFTSVDVGRVVAAWEDAGYVVLRDTVDIIGEPPTCTRVWRAYSHIVDDA